MVRERGSKQMRQVKIGDEAGEQIEDDKDKRGGINSIEGRKCK